MSPRRELYLCKIAIKMIQMARGMAQVVAIIGLLLFSHHTDKLLYRKSLVFQQVLDMFCTFNLQSKYSQRLCAMPGTTVLEAKKTEIKGSCMQEPVYNQAPPCLKTGCYWSTKNTDNYLGLGSPPPVSVTSMSMSSFL